MIVRQVSDHWVCYREANVVPRSLRHIWISLWGETTTLCFLVSLWVAVGCGRLHLSVHLFGWVLPGR